MLNKGKQNIEIKFCADLKRSYTFLTTSLLAAVWLYLCPVSFKFSQSSEMNMEELLLWCFIHDLLFFHRFLKEIWVFQRFIYLKSIKHYLIYPDNCDIIQSKEKGKKHYISNQLHWLKMLRIASKDHVKYNTKHKSQWLMQTLKTDSRHACCFV